MSESGVGFDIVRVGDKAYIRGSEAFYKQFGGASAAQLLQGEVARRLRDQPASSPR